MAPKKAGTKKEDAKAKAPAKAEAKAKTTPKEAKEEAKVKTTPKEETAAAVPVQAAATEEPAAKKAKTADPSKESEKEEQKVEEKVEPEEPKEEIDAPSDNRPPFKGSIGFEHSETTLNVVQASGGRVLMSYGDGGIQYLIAGARANVGQKSGRYMYEVRLVESLSPNENGGNRQEGNGPKARQLLRVGFSVAGSSLILGDGESNGIYFDSEGMFFDGKKRSSVSGKRFHSHCVAAVLLNLDAKTPLFNTVSLFVDGVRVGKPQPLPENFHGKTLFPHISYRNMTVQVHFGPEPLAALPFKCRTLLGAANADLSKSKVTPGDGKCDVVYPVGFPDEGTFSWLDTWLEKNPHYVELSDRKILEWAAKSGLTAKGNPGSNDKPSFNFGIPTMDDGSITRMVKNIAPLMPRNYVIMEVKQNLMRAERAESLKRFPSRSFKKIAHVVMGEPSKDFKMKVKDKLLAAKQAKLEAEYKRMKAEKERKKFHAEKKAKAEEARKKIQEARKKASAKEKGEDTEEVGKEETKAEEQPKEDKDLAKQEDEEDKGPGTAELTEEEANNWFVKAPSPDIFQSVLDKSFADFTIPDAAEGFDDVKFEWQREKAAKEYLQKWVLQKKRTCKIDSLMPTAWFKEQADAWHKKKQAWVTKQREIKGKSKTKAGEEEDDDVSVKVAAVEDVMDVGDGKPLFLKFTAQDWALLQIRWELHMLVTAFKKELNDPDRVAIPEQHIGFYYQRFYKKPLTTKLFGKESLQELVVMLKDTVSLEGDENAVLSSILSEDTSADQLLKLVELKRRERQRRIDAGDETAKLSFHAPDPLKAGGKW